MATESMTETLVRCAARSREHHAQYANRCRDMMAHLPALHRKVERWLRGAAARPGGLVKFRADHDSDVEVRYYDVSFERRLVTKEGDAIWRDVPVLSCRFSETNISIIPADMLVGTSGEVAPPQRAARLIGASCSDGGGPGGFPLFPTVMLGPLPRARGGHLTIRYDGGWEVRWDFGHFFPFTSRIFHQYVDFVLGRNVDQMECGREQLRDAIADLERPCR